MSHHTQYTRQQARQGEILRHMMQLVQDLTDMNSHQTTPAIHEDVIRVQNQTTRARGEIILARESTVSMFNEMSAIHDNMVSAFKKMTEAHTRMVSALNCANQSLRQVQAKMEHSFVQNHSLALPAATQSSLATTDNPSADLPINTQSSDSALNSQTDAALLQDLVPMIKRLMRQQSLEEKHFDHVWRDLWVICESLYVYFLDRGAVTLEMDWHGFPIVIRLNMKEVALQRLKVATGLDLTPAEPNFCTYVIRMIITVIRQRWKTAVLAPGITPQNDTEWTEAWLAYDFTRSPYFFLRHAQLMAMHPPPDWVLLSSGTTL
ncbi:hypothetical protein BC940DRAFT_351640 [Gongronella butleri]|nr:hypothetical protein BC940DRAFT_351640 [Gongronella butleri]